MRIDYEKRFQEFCRILPEEAEKAGLTLKAYLLTKEEDIHYLSGFRGDSTWLLAGPDCRILLTDSRYTEQALQQAPGWEVLESRLITGAAEIAAGKGPGCLGYDPLSLNVATYRRLHEELVNAGVRPEEAMAAMASPTVRMRRIKDQAELELIGKACSIADQALEEVLPLLKPGITEKRLAAELEYRMALLGSEGPSFPTIVASGLRGALPHGLAGEKLLRKGDMVTIDFGAVYQGYHSDMTRTFILGKPKPLQKDRYLAVLAAQEAALAALAPGKALREIDAVARNYLKEIGLDRYFGHGLGHSLGLEIHEEPRFSPLAPQEFLAPGMVMTVEPGIYLPEWGGLRIEDTCVITEKTCRFLTKFTKALEDITMI
ncbi:MAG: aminopeptidase P family protein [Peptococcaceae bacterium]|nr:aminopeptidase P family protein [Peptococcaceae bacterium]